MIDGLKRLIFVGLTAACLAGMANANDIKWAKDYSTALSDAKASGKIVMIDFYTDWCGWCKKLDSDTYPNPKVVALADNFATVKVNAEKEGVDLAKKYNIQGYPTIVFLDPDENLVYKVVGYEPADGFAKELTNVTKSVTDFKTYSATLATSPNDFGALAGLTTLYAKRENLDKAKELLGKAEAVQPSGGSDVLADAYNGVGDLYQNQNKFDDAIPYFQKAVSTGKDPAKVVYAHVSIAVCYLSQNKAKLAIPEAEAALAVKGISDEDAKQAQQLLDAAKKQADGKN